MDDRLTRIEEQLMHLERQVDLLDESLRDAFRRMEAAELQMKQMERRLEAMLEEDSNEERTSDVSDSPFMDGSA